MRISLWMLGNQLGKFDPEINIRNNAPISLKSARRAYSTDCVHVYQEKDVAVIKAEGGEIRINDMNAAMAFEIVQSIFDFYNDWHDKVTEYAREYRWQDIIDISWHIFHNPIILMNTDCLIMAKTDSDHAETVDEEWDGLEVGDYSSYRTIRNLLSDPSWSSKRNKGGAQYYKSPNEKLNNCISISIRQDEVEYARMNVVECYRSVNEGDFQLLELLSRIMSPNLNLFFINRLGIAGYNVFYEMVNGRKVGIDPFTNRMSYKQWSDQENYEVVVMNFHTDTMLMKSVTNRFAKYSSSVETINVRSMLVFILNRSKKSYREARDYINFTSRETEIKIGVSLPLCGLVYLWNHFNQALDALRIGEMMDPGKTEYSFFDYAMDYMFETSFSKQYAQLCACHPDVVALARDCSRQGDFERVNTLKCFLENDCSPSKAAKELFLHKNTLLYRVSKIQESLEYPMDTKYSKDYLQYSMHIMEMYRKRDPGQTERFFTNALDR